MTLLLSAGLLEQIRRHGETDYPLEGAGLILGSVDGDQRRAMHVLPLPNRFEHEARSRRYQISPADLMAGEQEAERRGLDVIGVFHSHPDHPARASSFDREWALPWLSYLITSVRLGQAGESLSWRLTDDRSAMLEEPIHVVNTQPSPEDG